MALINLCQLSDINDGDARGFDVVIAQEEVSVICIRQGQQVFAYNNSCPHTGVNLEWMPHQFLDNSRQYIMCSTHGALFQIHDGRCIKGPCVNEHMLSLPVSIVNGDVLINTSMIKMVAAT